MPTYRELLAQARAEIDEITTPEAHRLLADGVPHVFVDVRPRDEWDEVEKKWERLKVKLSALQETAEDVSEDIGHALKKLASEIEEGYERIRKQV